MLATFSLDVILCAIWEGCKAPMHTLSGPVITEHLRTPCAFAFQLIISLIVTAATIFQLAVRDES